MYSRCMHIRTLDIRVCIHKHCVWMCRQQTIVILMSRRVGERKGVGEKASIREKTTKKLCMNTRTGRERKKNYHFRFRSGLHNTYIRVQYITFHTYTNRLLCPPPPPSYHTDMCANKRCMHARYTPFRQSLNENVHIYCCYRCSYPCYWMLMLLLLLLSPPSPPPWWLHPHI